MVKQPRRGANNAHPSDAEVKETVQLYLYTLSVPSWHVTGWTLPLLQATNCNENLGARKPDLGCHNSHALSKSEILDPEVTAFFRMSVLRYRRIRTRGSRFPCFISWRLARLPSRLLPTQCIPHTHTHTHTEETHTHIHAQTRIRSHGPEVQAVDDIKLHALDREANKLGPFVYKLRGPQNITQIP